jgi:hypothetical protein
MAFPLLLAVAASPVHLKIITPEQDKAIQTFNFCFRQKADISHCKRHVRFSCQRQTCGGAKQIPLSVNIDHSFDDLVGAGKQRSWNGYAERFRRGQIDCKIELGRLLDREITGLGPTQNLIDKLGCAPEQVWIVWPIRH